MKIVAIGDIHGRKGWKDIVTKESDADLFIFLGDYVSTHEDISEEQQIENLYDILGFAESHPDKVVLLRGNHDMQHLGYSWAECSGRFREVEKEMSKPFLKNMYLADTQWVYVVDNIVFSHAGITKRWFKDSGCKTVENINTLEPSELFGFRPCKFSDYYGISETQGPTWIRPQTLFEYALPGYTQVVGHTPVKHIFNMIDAAKRAQEECKDDPIEDLKTPKGVDGIWLCDCSLKQYLVIKDGKFTVEVI